MAEVKLTQSPATSRFEYKKAEQFPVGTYVVLKGGLGADREVRLTINPNRHALGHNLANVTGNGTQLALTTVYRAMQPGERVVIQANGDAKLEGTPKAPEPEYKSANNFPAGTLIQLQNDTAVYMRIKHSDSNIVSLRDGLAEYSYIAKFRALSPTEVLALTNAPNALSQEEAAMTNKSKY